MSFGPKEINEVILHMESVSYKQHLKEIKITNDFYNYLTEKHTTKIILENTPEGVIYRFIGVPIVIDNEINSYYELVFEKEN